MTHGMDGTLGELVDLAAWSSVGDVVARLGSMGFADTVRTKAELQALVNMRNQYCRGSRRPEAASPTASEQDDVVGQGGVSRHCLMSEDNERTLDHLDRRYNRGDLLDRLITIGGDIAQALGSSRAGERDGKS